MYQFLDAAMVRAVAWPPGHPIPSWPDLVGEADAAESWRPWLEQALRIPGFAAALEQATPVLARRVRDICAGRELPENAVRKAVMAVMRYVLRASGRATPFGLFAGVAPVEVAETTAVRLGTRHRAIAGPTAEWLTAVIERLEAEPALQPHLTVQAHALVVKRDGHLVLEHRSSGPSGGAPAHVRVRASTPVASAMDAARSPILLADLAGKLASEFPGVPADVIARLLAGLVDQRFLVTSLRPPMTTADPLGHLLATLPAQTVSAVAETGNQLREIADGMARHNTAPTSDLAHTERGRLTAAMRNLAPVSGPALTVDLRLEGGVTVPRLVAEEAARAANVLTKLAGRPALSAAWVTWHSRFLERYGPRALVPLLDAVDGDIGLGYPAGFLGAPPAPSGRTPTERDIKLLNLAQNAALRRQHEIALDETTVSDLATPVPDARVQPTTELTVRVHATSPRALDTGDFTLAIVGVSRTAGTTVGRFLNLLDAGDWERMAKTFATAPGTNEGALTVQISAPPLYASAENVARTPRVMPTLLALGECRDHGDEPGIRLEDIAVTADVDRLYLLSVSRRRPLEFVTLNAVEPTRYTHPLVRFLTEATVALSIPCTPFDWGAAAGLPFLPALRHGRTILSPARWRLMATDLASDDAEWAEWDESLAAWRNQVAAPSTVYVGDGDQRIRLNLAESSHRALLRAHIQRDGTAMLRAEPAAGAAGWAGGRVHEIVIPMASATKPGPAPQGLDAAQAVARDHGHLPGCGGRFFVKLYGRPDHYGSILTHHLPALLGELSDEVRWWFLPYRDPEDHLRLRLSVPVGAAATATAVIGAWSQRLRRTGLVARVQWDTDFPETARFGGAAAMDSAEAYFAADSQAAVAQIAASAAKGGPDARALTAASMLDLVTGLIGNPAEAMTWLVTHARTTTTPPARALYNQAVTLANPNHQRRLASQPGGEQIVTSWSRRRDALAAYRTALVQAGTADATALLPELLHLHHTRIVGVDLEAERQCLHLARAAALSWTARARGTS
ncbi:lantibiotic dehydratase [Streptomyces sp. NBC_01803]|uniref:lantibiotic dehydratase n=1 Tax=Streptomyces sp. NBC_01803 TaxID=2975946 RepID=UPI002DDAC7D3|nr:lantibiotic dehydratase [Streptomyces sp. NBC_01803]WSA46381.1 lantibiotic dehydratase [Streptomyces sp. NBC_01803]